MPATDTALSLTLTSSSGWRDYVQLTKPGVLLLVVFAGLIGMLVSPIQVHPIIGLTSIICLTLGSASAAMINMWYDRDIDQLMSRTHNRPLPAGRIDPSDALALGLSLAGLSVALLGLATNWMAAAMLAFAIFFYGVVYTMLLKRHTVHNIVIGGLAGALPPLIGWMATGAAITPLPLLLVAFIFFWTPPHFFALACVIDDQYRNAHVPMLPVVRGIVYTHWQSLIYILILAIIQLALVYVHAAGVLFFVMSSVLWGIFLIMQIRCLMQPTRTRALNTFFYSIFYLFTTLATLAIDHMLMMG